MLKQLLFVAVAASLALGQSDTPTIGIQLWTNDPQVTWFIPGPSHCNPCQWGAFLYATTADTNTRAFLVDFEYTADSGLHQSSALVSLTNSAPNWQGGGYFVLLGNSPVTNLRVLRWYRITQISSN